MAHNLTTLNGQTAMMFVGEVPWHGLGTKLEKPATAAEAIKAAGLDWAVSKVALHLKAGSRYPVVPNQFAIVRNDRRGQPTSAPFGIVGKGYTPLQNKNAFAWFDAIVGEGSAIYHTAGALGEGERVWLLAKLPGEMRVIGDDIAEKYLLLSNSHDGKSSVQVKFTPIRVVCQNTLTMALSLGKGIRMSHLPSLPLELTLARQNLGIITTKFAEIEEGFQKMAAISLDKRRIDEYLVGVFPDPDDQADERANKRIKQVRADVLRLFETGQGNQQAKVKGTLWAAYNGVTEYMDHHFRHRNPNSRLDSVWFGTGYLTKARAFGVALEKVPAWKN
jgi:phage/plasmid-like protein (TIGR03299 family)